VNMALPERTPLALLPTPLQRLDRLTRAWGGPNLWVKRDDLTGFELSGNKVRKLEFHFAAAASAAVTTVITCGAVQSNHCRATALAAAQLGFRAILYLRSPNGRPPDTAVGNHLLTQLAGAELRFITPAEYEQRDEIMAAAAAEQPGAAWVIPEGASDALGMWGYVLAMREIHDQVARIPGPPPTLWHAASSGGTTAGIGWGADRLGSRVAIAACSVGESAASLRARVEKIWAEAGTVTHAPTPSIPIDYIDHHVGGGYGVVSDEELLIQREATSLTGLIFDPTYTGKAIVGLHRDIAAGRFGSGDNVVFWHTGGGFAAFAHDFSRTGVAAAPAAGSA